MVAQLALRLASSGWLMLHACATPSRDSFVTCSAAPGKKTSWSSRNLSTSRRAASACRRRLSPSRYKSTGRAARTTPTSTTHSPLGPLGVMAVSLIKTGACAASFRAVSGMATSYVSPTNRSAAGTRTAPSYATPRTTSRPATAVPPAAGAPPRWSSETGTPLGIGRQAAQWVSGNGLTSRTVTGRVARRTSRGISSALPRPNSAAAAAPAAGIDTMKLCVTGSSVATPSAPSSCIAYVSPTKSSSWCSASFHSDADGFSLCT
mmetsp:Transcript_27861/g.88691  ORF Transcript_27861/g.88691 Transcript_27861/m.88691 type:complete len:263 (-) Transcript_27861:259-1047(-)